MSVITHATIQIRNAPEQVRNCIRYDIPDVMDERRQAFKWIPMDHAGGSKYFVIETFAAAFNHIDPRSLIDWFRTLPWDPESIAAMTIFSEKSKYEMRTIQVIGNEVIDHGEE